MNKNLEIRKVIGGAILAILFVCWFLFIKPSLVVDWTGNGDVLTPLNLLGAIVGIVVLVLYHIFYQSTPETNKLSWTIVLTIFWLALIIFYPFKELAKDPLTEGTSGAVGFFTLIGGLAVVVFWVRFFSDEIVTNPA